VVGEHLFVALEVERGERDHAVEGAEVAGDYEALALKGRELFLGHRRGACAAAALISPPISGGRFTHSSVDTAGKL
jgi:hypothetical protein